MSEDKPDLSQFLPEGWEGKYPPCLIQVDQDGGLFHDGAPIIHPAVLQTIYSSVHLEEGRYILKVDHQVCELEVKDTFFVVQSAAQAGDRLVLTLNDGSREDLDPATLAVGAEEVLYCRVKRGKFPARFLRPAYYQVTDLVEEAGEGFALRLGERSFPIPHRP
ncbi:MAG: DUF1285 domain-containing protein [Deltaproteobacteria bacterium]|nr:DUF1285 domain-containing protein [Deltaproteobacteria bacterium]